MESYQRLIDFIAIQNARMYAEHWLLTQVLVWSTLWQILAVIFGLGLAYAASRPLRRRMEARVANQYARDTLASGFARSAVAVAFPLIGLLLVGGAAGFAAALGRPAVVLTTVVNLLAAWVMIRLISGVIRTEFWSRLIAFLAFGVATLNILGFLGPTLVYLDHLGLRLGNTRLSVLDLLRAAVQLGVLLWLALTASRLLEKRVEKSRSLTPSLRVLTSKMLRFSLVALASVVALTSVGIDLTAFALFTGALGVGIGFALQKPISNLISGLILLFDRSIRPGDVVELTEAYHQGVQIFGWVTALNARYVSVTTRDGTEWLIPNEQLITQRVINWSYTNNRLRLLTPIGISFDCDVRLAMQLVEEAARGTPRVLSHPAPVCRLMGFGDSSVQLEMRFWIDDPVNGIINVRSEVMLAVWEKFRENGIRTPLGHRDIFIKGDSELTVRIDRASGSAAA